MKKPGALLGSSEVRLGHFKGYFFDGSRALNES